VVSVTKKVQRKTAASNGAESGFALLARAAKAFERDGDAAMAALASAARHRAVTRGIAIEIAAKRLAGVAIKPGADDSVRLAFAYADRLIRDAATGELSAETTAWIEQLRAFGGFKGLRLRRMLALDAIKEASEACDESDQAPTPKIALEEALRTRVMIREANKVTADIAKKAVDAWRLGRGAVKWKALREVVRDLGLQMPKPNLGNDYRDNWRPLRENAQHDSVK
jgi:hypothetical protein